MEQKFKVTFNLENDNNIHSCTFTKDIECSFYLDRVEECHGYHEMYEPNEEEFETNVTSFIENIEDELLKEIINENYNGFTDDYQQITKVIELIAA